MKNYKIVVNGTAYEVAIEEISASEVTEKKAEAPKAPAAAPAATVPAGGEKITAPIPGTVLDICVANGTSVKAGAKILILESMKMENEILAPVDGVVTVVAQKGAAVVAGDVLATIA